MHRIFIVLGVCLWLGLAQPSLAVEPQELTPQQFSAEQAYREILAWASGSNSNAYLDDLFLKIEREAYRYNILPEFALAVVAAEARYGYGISWARYDSWKMYELTTGTSKKPYPNTLDDLSTALSELRMIMSSSTSVNQVLSEYWCGPRGEFNKDSFAAFSEAASKLWNALEPYARQRVAAQEKEKFEQSQQSVRDPVSNPWAGLAYGDMDGYKSSMNSMPALAAQLESFGEDEQRYAAVAKTINKNLSDAEATVIARAILTYCKQTNWRVDPRLVMAMVKCESGFKPRAVSPVGALGLAQLMPATARSFGIKDAFDPVQNLYGCVRYLDREVYRWRNREDWLDLVIASYNAGPGAVQKYNGVPPYKETRNHVKVVKGYYFKLAPEVAKAYGR
jgi:soluble lytic murein transglycosylase-like protein